MSHSDSLFLCFIHKEKKININSILRCTSMFIFANQLLAYSYRLCLSRLRTTSNTVSGFAPTTPTDFRSIPFPPCEKKRTTLHISPRKSMLKCKIGWQLAKKEWETEHAFRSNCFCGCQGRLINHCMKTDDLGISLSEAKTYCYNSVLLVCVLSRKRSWISNSVQESSEK